jgi:hypothetical protein
MDLTEIRARVLSSCVREQPWCAQAPCYTVYAATNKRATRLDNTTDGCGFVWITFAAGGWRCHSSRYSCVCVCLSDKLPVKAGTRFFIPPQQPACLLLANWRHGGLVSSPAGPPPRLRPKPDCHRHTNREVSDRRTAWDNHHVSQLLIVSARWMYSNGNKKN